MKMIKTVAGVLVLFCTLSVGIQFVHAAQVQPISEVIRDQNALYGQFMDEMLRMVVGFKDKDLKVREFPVSAKLTPEHFAELDFTWKDDQTIITSRVKESEWSNDFSKHPLPLLYAIDIGYNKQKQITFPPQGQGDYHPKYLKNSGKLAWFRGESIIGKSDVWISNADGSGAKSIVGNVDYAVFYEQ